MCNVLNGDTMTCDYGVSKVLSKDSSVRVMHSKQQQSVHRQQQSTRKVGVMGSRRIFPPSFKLKVLHSYRNDVDCRGNQRATARKFGIHRRQIQKWLQCEENLKNCAENGNARPASTSTTDSSASVSKSDSATVTAEATGPTGPAAIPAAPALNLNVARLHGDELTPQQRSPPPASPPHLPRCGASPPTRLRTIPKNMLLQNVLNYSQYSPLSSDVYAFDVHAAQDQKYHLREAENAMPAQETHYVDAQADQDRDYYEDMPTVDVEMMSVRSCDRNEIAAHESIRGCHWSSTEHQCAAKDTNETIAHSQRHQQRHHSPNHRAQTYGNVDLFNGHLHGLIGAPLIKTEPASPDSAATSGPYEPAGSPDGQWAPQSPTVSHQVANSSSGSSLSAHFNSTAGPSDVHVHEHAHARTLLVSIAPYSSRLHRHERESEETTGYAEEKGEQKERTEYCGTVIKEEVDLPEDEIYDERLENNASPYIDVTGDLSRDTLEDSENAPVEMDDCSASSPDDPVNSGRSSSNSSDSEMGSLDGVPGNQNSSANLTRRQQLRRSFPLSFKLDVLDAFHKDADVAGNQRATARKFDINRRQVQKWLLKETDLRDEIALRGDSRQRLAPTQEGFVNSPIDLRRICSNCTALETEYEQSHRHYYEVDGNTRIPCIPTLYFNETAPSVEVEPAEQHCILSCCADRRTTTSTTSSSLDLSLRGSYTESPSGLYCYSPKDYAETYSLPEERPPSSKRQTYSWNNAPSPKRFCSDNTTSQRNPLQDRPLCLVKGKEVKPKTTWRIASQMEEEVASSSLSESEAVSASQPSSSTPVRDDGILFKPYLDNPVCRPASNDAALELSPKTRENIINNNKRSTDSGINDNDIIHCQRIYKTNKNRNSRLQLNVHLPSSLRPLTNPKADLDHISYGDMNFTRYPAHHETRNSCLFNYFRPYDAQTMGNPHLAINQNGFVITRHPHLIVYDQITM